MLRRLWPGLWHSGPAAPAPWHGGGHRRLASTCPDHVVRSPHGDVLVPEETIPEYVWKGLRKWEKHILIECGVSGRKLTYAQARDSSARLAASLTSRRARELGVERGGVVTVVLPNGPDFPVALLGVIEAGLVFSPVNPAFPAGEIAKQLAKSRSSLVITDAPRFAAVSAAAAVAAAATRTKPATVVCVADSPQGRSALPQGAVDFSELVAGSVDVAAVARPEGLTPRDTALMPFSSGTTGEPKGVMLSHRNSVSNLYQIHHKKVIFYREASNDYQEVFPVVLPFYHIYGVSGILLNLISIGAKFISLPKFDPTTYIRTLTEHTCTGLHLVPPLLLFLAGREDVKPEMLAALRIVYCAAAPVGEEDIERLRTKMSPGVFIRQAYGMTETSPVVTEARYGVHKYASVGPPLPSTEIVIRDVSTGATLGPHQRGELCIRGPQVMKGYFDNPEATAQSIDSNGFLRSGDIAYYDNDGDFFIVDRLKELIKVKGFQVPPAELEELLRSHPLVDDAAVVGVPDGRSGESPRAYIVPKANGPRPSPEDIAAFVAAKVVDYKQLKGGVRFIDAIPKNPSGKILRRKLKEMT